jgi:hypothetical protein
MISQKPPEAMTRVKSMPIIIVAGVFDLVRIVFEAFVFFGPALAAFFCTLGVNNWIGTTLATTAGKTAAMVCTAGAGVVGFFGAGPIASFGFIMSDAVGFIAFLVLGLWILLGNSRLFKTAASAPWQFIGAFAVSEIPFVGAIPIFAIILWRLYGAQIRIEQAALKKWETDHAAELQQQRQQQIAQFAQIQQFRAQEAENDEQSQQDETANDAQYTQDMREAA